LSYWSQVSGRSEKREWLETLRIFGIRKEDGKRIIGIRLVPQVVCCSFWGKTYRSMSPSPPREVRGGGYGNDGDTLTVEDSSSSIFIIEFVGISLNYYFYLVFSPPFFRLCSLPPAGRRTIRVKLFFLKKEVLSFIRLGTYQGKTLIGLLEVRLFIF